jgi:replicative DNA helicase
MSNVHSLRPLPKTPPYNVEAEQSVLGSLMLVNSVFDDVSTIVSASDFYREDHQVIFSAIAQQVGKRQPTDFVTLTAALESAGRLSDVGGLSYLGMLANDTPSAANVLAYARIVRERSILRSLIAVGGDIAEMGWQANGSEVRELLDRAEQLVHGIADHGAQHTTLSAADDAGEWMTALEERRRRGNMLGGLSTGLVDLDRILDGLHPGDLVIIAGRPSMGKTVLGTDFARSCADAGKRAMVFSMEMPRRQLITRLVAGIARVPMNNLRDGRLDDRDMDRITVALGNPVMERLIIDDEGSLTVSALRAKARREARDGLSLIVVDYLQLMQSDARNDQNRNDELSTVSRGLKTLAKELGIPIVALAQLNRGVEQRDNKRPRLSDLRDSGAIEQDADVVIGCYRDEYYRPDSSEKGIAELLILKQRQGETGIVKAAFSGAFAQFQNLAPEYGDWE